MDEQRSQLKTVCEIVAAVVDGEFIDKQDPPEALLRKLDDLLSSFFTVLERLEMANARELVSCASFETHLMWNAVYCEMLARQSVTFEKLETEKVFSKYFSDLGDCNGDPS